MFPCGKMSKRVMEWTMVVVVTMVTMTSGQNMDATVEFLKAGAVVQLAYGGGQALITCKIDRKCDASSSFEMIHESEGVLAKVPCHPSDPLQAFFRLEIKENTPFGRYSCQYEKSSIEALNLRYRTCAKTEHKACKNLEFCMVQMGKPGPECISKFDPAICDVQHRNQIETGRRVCPAGQKTLCHAVAAGEYPLGAMVESETCDDPMPKLEPGNPILEQMIIMAPKMTFRMSCPPKDIEGSCGFYKSNGMQMVETATSPCRSLALEVPDDAFARSDIYHVECLFDQGKIRLLAFAIHLEHKAICQTTMVAGHHARMDCDIDPTPLSGSNVVCNITKPDGSVTGSWMYLNDGGSYKGQCSVEYTSMAPYKVFSRIFEGNEIKFGSEVTSTGADRETFVGVPAPLDMPSSVASSGDPNPSVTAFGDWNSSVPNFEDQNSSEISSKIGMPSKATPLTTTAHEGTSVAESPTGVSQTKLSAPTTGDDSIVSVTSPDAGISTTESEGKSAKEGFALFGVISMAEEDAPIGYIIFAVIILVVLALFIVGAVLFIRRRRRKRDAVQKKKEELKGPKRDHGVPAAGPKAQKEAKSSRIQGSSISGKSSSDVSSGNSDLKVKGKGGPVSKGNPKEAVPPAKKGPNAQDVKGRR